MICTDQWQRREANLFCELQWHHRGCPNVFPSTGGLPANGLGKNISTRPCVSRAVRKVECANYLLTARGAYLQVVEGASFSCASGVPAPHGSQDEPECCFAVLLFFFDCLGVRREAGSNKLQQPATGPWPEAICFRGRRQWQRRSPCNIQTVGH